MIAGGTEIGGGNFPASCVQGLVWPLKFLLILESIIH